MHLKRNHEMSGPTSDNVIDNGNNSDDDMDANKDVEARCIHCNGKFIVYVNKLKTLHKHLVEVHADKLTEEEKKEVKLYWAWDYFTLKDCTIAMCNICQATIRCKQISSLKNHLSRIHK
ncbi:hypothetical protein ALC60_11819 [Trachymyrmex zeteki]|uniref:BED-type domain-containing protein n=1 Tax=Mycetomoellerius zeteki TaxID=64791 RepID=A0A151WMS4_9HYME|nr:hypothetical protein ALC60_11819 [Trachymyrmex zeteki]